MSSPFSETNSNVFTCPLCHLRYNKTKRLPICLECGDVICLSCIKSLTLGSSSLKCIHIKCPLDSKKIQIRLNSLQPCKTILSFLPLKDVIPSSTSNIVSNLNSNQTTTNDNFMCNEHPFKKIKYYCESENISLCIDCIDKHSNNKHKVVKFNPTKTSFKNEVDSISKSVFDKKEQIQNKVKELLLNKNNYRENLAVNLNILNNKTNAIINTILLQKKQYIKQMQNDYDKAVNIIDSTIKTYTRLLNDINNIINGFDLLCNCIQECNCYDNVNNKKNDLLCEWESLLVDTSKEMMKCNAKVIKWDVKYEFEFDVDNESDKKEVKREDVLFTPRKKNNSSKFEGQFNRNRSCNNNNNNDVNNRKCFSSYKKTNTTQHYVVSTTKRNTQISENENGNTNNTIQRFSIGSNSNNNYNCNIEFHSPKQSSSNNILFYNKNMNVVSINADKENSL